MKKSIVIFVVIAGIAYVAKKAGANVKAQLEERKNQVDQLMQ